MFVYVFGLSLKFFYLTLDDVDLSVFLVEVILCGVLIFGLFYLLVYLLVDHRLMRSEQLVARGAKGC